MPGPPPRRPGRLAGGGIAVAFVVVLVLLAGQFPQSFDIVVYGALLGIVAGTVGIAIPRTRPYATGFLLGLALIVTVAAGACIGLIAVLSSAH